MRTQATPPPEQPDLVATEIPSLHELLDRLTGYGAPPDPADDTLTFAPVPSLSSRHDGWTPKRQHEFVAALAELGLVTAAARSVGMSPRSAYALLKRAGAGSGFALAWTAAVDQGHARALDLAIARAVNGVTKPVFYRGRQIAEVRCYDNRLLLAALRSTTGRTAAGEEEPWRD